MAARKKATGKSGLQKFYWVLGVVILVGVGAIAFSMYRSNATEGATIAPVAVADSTDVRALYAKAKPEQIGRAEAPVKMVVFSDYQCPYCGQFASQVQPALVNDYVKTGKLQFVYYDFPLGGAHKYSFLAARGARCAADQNKFWEYHDLLFGQQSEWSFATSVPVDLFDKYADQVGLNRTQFDACLKSDKYADVVTANRMLGDQLGVNATPTILINNRRISDALNYQEIKDIIKKEGGV